MKIFNNFDTKLKEKEYHRVIEKYGKEEVVMVERGKFFWIFRGVLPLVIFLVVSSVLLFLAFSYFYTEYTAIFWLIIFVVLLGGIYMFFYVLHIFIDYKMDFTIVTKHGVMTHSQEGFFFHKSKDLPSSKIRSIQAARDGLLGNIFGYGYIEIITDGSVSEINKEEGGHMPGKTKLTFVDNPNKVKEKIKSICLAVSG